MTPVSSPLGIAERALGVSDDLLAALRDHVVERRIRDRALASHQAVAHTLADHWVTLEAVRAALATAVARADERAADPSIAVALGATRALRALCDDAVRLRGGRGYLAGDTAAEARLEAMRLTNALGEPDRLTERLGRPDRGSPNPKHGAIAASRCSSSRPGSLSSRSPRCPPTGARSPTGWSWTT